MSILLHIKINSPLEQFYVLSPCLYFSNTQLMFFLIAFIIICIFELNKKTFNFSLLEFFIRTTLSVQKTTLSENLNITKLIYFPYNYILFIFILIANVFGMIPYSYTITSAFIIVLFLSMTTMIGITIIGIVQHGFKILGLFLLSGSSFLMIPLLMVIEIISYFARVLSLAIRLFANMLSGHVLLKILAGVI